MDVCNIAAWIESNVRQRIDYTEMERAVGYSYHHIRDFFKRVTDVSLTRYILARQVANAAFEIRHNKKNMTAIADELDFSNTETFTRIFNRVVGLTPSQFKKSDYLCGRQIICPGVYAPVILNHDNPIFTLQHIKEVNAMSEMKKTADSCVLYGVPKVHFGREVDGREQNFPFPMCLQAVFNYMGQNISYTELLAYTGEAFRQRWEAGGWSPAAIDPRYLYERPHETYERGFNGAGRKLTVSVANDNVKSINKEKVTALIKSEIDCGRPVIALGVVGPPEACIITGYRDNGDTLLGWSLFSDWEDCGTDESGYFVKNDWLAEGLMVFGEGVGERPSDLEVLENALWMLETEDVNTYDGTWLVYGGTKAYEAWAAALEAEYFDQGGADMGHGDGEKMVLEGRAYAADYMVLLAQKHTGLAAEFKECARLFQSTVSSVREVHNLRCQHGLANAETRGQMADLIRKAAQHDQAAANVIKAIIVKMGGNVKLK